MSSGLHQKIQILLIEQNDSDITTIDTLLSKQNKFEFTISRHKKISSALKHLQNNIPDVILLDASLSEVEGVETFAEIKSEGAAVPIILLTREGCAKDIAQTHGFDADDYVVKDDLTQNELIKHIWSGIEKHHVLLVSSEADRQFKLMADEAPIMIWETNVAGKCIFFNKAWHAFWGKGSKVLRDENWQLGIHEEDIGRYNEIRSSAIDEVKPFSVQYRLRDDKGQYKWLLDSGSPSFDKNGMIKGFVGTTVDISDQKDAQEEAVAWQEKYIATIDVSNQILFEWDPENNEVKLSGNLESLVGFGSEDIQGGLEKWLSLVHPDDQKQVLQKITYGRKTKQTFEMQYRLRASSGTFITVRHCAKLNSNINKKTSIMIGFISNITQSLQTVDDLQDRELRYKTLVSNIPGAVYRYKYESKEGWSTEFVSDEIQNITGYEAQYFMDNDIQAFTSLVQEDDRRNREQAINEALQGDCSFAIDFRIIDKQGAIRWISEYGRITLDEETGKMWLDGVILDSTDRTNIQEKLDYVVYHDALTGLPNRMLFMDRLGQAIIAANHDHEQLTIFSLDMDHFKRINDTLGLASGDKLLKAIAKRFTKILYETDTVTRVDGDEFLILITGLKRPAQALAVVDKLFSTFQKSFFVDGHELFMTCSIGISIYPTDGYDVDSILKNANTAMNRAKEQGRNNYQLYTPTMNNKDLRRLKLENQLRHALDREELRIHYQPLVSLVDNEIVGMEALLRWNHQELGSVSPAEFIPLAEESGLIIPIGEWVLKKVCEQIKEWELMEITNARVCVNFSARQFRQRDFADNVIDIIEKAGVDPTSLEFELTEGTIMKDVDETIASMNTIKSFGMRISIDDFGTGYSSLSRLKRFPINTLKIDQSFVRDIPADPDDTAIAEAIISMGHSLNLEVVAEGVESIEQLQFLKEKECDIMQGFLFSRALPPIEMTELLMQHTSYNPENTPPTIS